jgi:hypothetical protein
MRFPLLIFSLLIYTLTFGQISRYYHQEDTISKSIAIGWSNPMSLFLQKFNEERLGIYSDYHHFTEDNMFLKLHFKFHPQNTTLTLKMNHFLVSIEKGKLIKSFKNLVLGHGIGGYYKCNLARTALGQGVQAQWNATYHGFGIQYHLFSDLLITKEWCLNLLIHLNAGLHQNFRSAIINPNNEVWELTSANQQLFSIGIKKRF